VLWNTVSFDRYGTKLILLTLLGMEPKGKKGTDCSGTSSSLLDLLFHK
jgi:hypothetical protein